MSRGQFEEISKLIRSGTQQLGDDIFVQGSRAGATTGARSDIDFGIRVLADKFDELISARFGNPNPGSAKSKTMQHAIETGKIPAGEAGLRSLRKQAESQLGIKTDLSTIRAGGPFDQGPFLPLR